jgi:hypothetical protein
VLLCTSLPFQVTLPFEVLNTEVKKMIKKKATCIGYQIIAQPKLPSRLVIK